MRGSVGKFPRMSGSRMVLVSRTVNNAGIRRIAIERMRSIEINLRHRRDRL